MKTEEQLPQHEKKAPVQVIIRPETEADYPSVFDLTEQAFRTLEISDHREQYLIERLRLSSSFVPELSLVACTDDDLIVGHILLTKIQIEDGSVNHEALILAPVSVLPAFQNQGIGSRLICAAHDAARELGFGAVVLVGHEHYYPRFGYRLCRLYGIRMPFDVPEVNCLVAELIPGRLQPISGLVKFDPAFFPE